jgi:hypothetical protein
MLQHFCALSGTDLWDWRFFSTSIVLTSYFLQENNRITFFITVFVVGTMYIP